MARPPGRLRVLYSFPHRLGSDRICTTAWHQVDSLVGAGADVTVHAASIKRTLPPVVRTAPTLAAGKVRMPFRLLGSMRAFALHDHIVSRRLERLASEVDIVHGWPLGCRRTLEVARRLGIPTALERPNAHTRFAYEVVARECERIGVELPDSHEHAFNEQVLEREEIEYGLATALLCPSDFVVRTFRDLGFSSSRLVRHQYGFDPSVFTPPDLYQAPDRGLRMLFVGGCAPRKGLHFALQAWLASPASRSGRFQIAGTFVKGYEQMLAPMLSHPSVEVLGQSSDVADLMRGSDVLVLPSIEEGSALVTSEARGCGCVLVVSDATGASCRHLDNSLIHSAGNIAMLTQHLTMLHEDRQLLRRLRESSLRTVGEITWDAAGSRLLQAYQEIIVGARTKGVLS
jgi:glycosyltransferase involved in cell wall biosynthesis